MGAYATSIHSNDADKNIPDDKLISAGNHPPVSERVVLTDEQYETLINGYMRLSSKSFHLDVPSALFGIVNMFYNKLDQWSKQLSDEGFEFICNGTIKRILPDNGHFINGYGAQGIKPSEYIPNQQWTNKYIFKTWRIKIKAIDTGYTMIGVIAESKIEKVTDHFCRDDLGYGYCTGKLVYPCGLNGRRFRLKTWLNIDVKIGYTIDVILYFKKGNKDNFRIGYRANGGDIEEVFHNLDINETYHFAVAFVTEQCVQFV